ncbi:MAG: hypothetical protein PHX08_23865 [Lachnospiraceae bacterium]|nr:hypothetical protein [Lachnospiraceae bacterium]
MNKENLEIVDEKAGNDSHKHRAAGMSIGMCLGVALGVSFGQMLFDNISLGMCYGLPIGMIIGMTIGAARDKQISKEAYKIKEIIPNENATEYSIIIVNRLGVEKTVIVSKREMATELFTIDDFVSLDEDGTIEQVANRAKKQMSTRRFQGY